MNGDSHDAVKQITGGVSLHIDNAALPDTRVMLSPCCMGKIIVPYLLASAWWEVTGHPTVGHSMFSAVRHNRLEFADPAFEWPEFVDTREADFARGFD